MRPESDDGAEPAVDAELEGRLADAHAAVLAREAERRRALLALPPPRPRADAGWVAAASASWLVVALVIIAPPALFRGAEPRPFAPLPATLEASLRYGIWLAHHQVADFARREGRMPSFLGEAGMSDSAIVLVVTGERTYRLVAVANGNELRFESAMSVDSFLGASLTRLREPDTD